MQPSSRRAWWVIFKFARLVYISLKFVDLLEIWFFVRKKVIFKMEWKIFSFIYIRLKFVVWQEIELSLFAFLYKLKY